MLISIAPVLVLFLLLLVLIGSVAFGRRFAYAQLKRGTEKLETVSVAESSVFGLLALLIAFTFSGAYDRFEKRKLHLVEEAAAFQRAYEYIEIFPQQYQAPLRQELKQYLSLHIEAFKAIPHFNQVDEILKQTDTAQTQLWNNIVIAAKATSQESLAQPAIEATESMFETAFTGQKLTRIHPPAVIFLLMIGLAALGAFLIGYDSAENRDKRHIHIVCYIVITAFTIFLIVNLEFPRTGFIGMQYFDEMLTKVQSAML